MAYDPEALPVSSPAPQVIMSASAQPEASTSRGPRRKRAPSPTDNPASGPRARVWRACEPCRKRKMRCDGNEPVCAHCQRLGKLCTWVSTADCGAASRRLQATYEERFARLEAMLGLATAAPDPVASNSAATAAQQAPLVAGPPPAQAPSDDLAGDGASDAADELINGFAILTVDAFGNRRLVGGMSNYGFVEAMKEFALAPGETEPPPESPALAGSPRSFGGAGMGASKMTRGLVDLPFFLPTVVDRPVSVGLPSPESMPFPPHSKVELLISLYFVHIHPLLPILDRDMFVTRLGQVAVERKDGAFIAVLFSVFAAASRLDGTEPPADNERRAAEYYERARVLLCGNTGTGTAQVEHVQTLAILALYLGGINAMPQAWLQAGHAVRIAQDLGLHRSAVRFGFGVEEGEARSRLWWSIYGLDRSLSLSLGRPAAINDSDCDAELPSVQAGADAPLGSFIAVSELYTISSKIASSVHSNAALRDLASPIRSGAILHRAKEIDADVTSWSAQHAAAMAARSDALWTVAHFLRAALLINLHRLFIPDPAKPHAASDASSLGKCIDAARACIDCADAVHLGVPPSHLLTICGQAITCSAVWLLRCAIFAQDTAPDALRLARRAADVLAGMTAVWPGAWRCSEIVCEFLEAVERRWTTPSLATEGAQGDERPQVALDGGLDLGGLDFWPSGITDAPFAMDLDFLLGRDRPSASLWANL